jgi:aspartyl-tRNA(Asn)/glutamyl-tRNA(Gln) amidotransferase subunit B
MYLNDIFTVTVNMAGLPGIAVPGGFDGEGPAARPAADRRPFDEETLFAAGQVIEDAAGDLNRSGVALMEIVSKPDIRSSEQAKAYVTKLRAILRYLGTCDGDMEKGNLRADVNVSVRRPASRLVRAARSRTSTRSASSARRSKSRRAARSRSRRRRHHRPGDAAVRSGPRRDALDALQGRGARLPLLPRSRPAAARIRRTWVDGSRQTCPELPDEKQARFVSDYGLSSL